MVSKLSLRKGKFLRTLLLVVLSLFLFEFQPQYIHAQSVSFELKTSPNVAFSFDRIQEFETGITIPNVTLLNIEVSGTQWDLYVGTTTTSPGLWDAISTYSTNGTDPDVSMVELQFRNVNNTSQVTGFFSLSDISTPTYIIGSATAPDAAVSCPAQGTNQAGSYTTDPQCYQFRVDMRIKPGFDYKPGLYTLRVDYVIVEDL